MTKNINRRQFIKNSALLSMSGFIPASGIAATRRATTTGEKFMNFNYKPNGKSPASCRIWRPR